MRTTLTVEDDIIDALQQEAARARVPFKTIVNRALRLGLERLRPSPGRKRFRQQTFRMGDPAGPNLDKALQLAALLDDEERARKLGLGR